MSFFRRFLLFFAAGGCSVLYASASPTPLVTGNGFGFAVVSPETGNITKFYAHPYSFTRPDPKDPLGEGEQTANFIETLRWSDGTDERRSADYVQDSHIIHIPSTAGSGSCFMPFGLPSNTLIVSWRPGTDHQGYWDIKWTHTVSVRKDLQVSDVDVRQLKFEGVSESLLLIPIGTRTQVRQTGDLSSNSSWALVSIEDDSQLGPAVREFQRWRGRLSPDRLEKRELAEVEHWRVKPGVTFHSEKERHLWRQSEILLRIAQSREPNLPGRYSNGLIVAALPEGAFFTPWVRDMAFAAAALIGMGHREEARAAILAYFNARPTGKMRHDTGGLDYQVSVVRYFGDGSEEPFFTMEGSTNIEYDNWGTVLWLLGAYLQHYKDPDLLRVQTYRGQLYESARDYIVKPLLAVLEPYDDGLIVASDTSIWEERQKDKKHFAYSTATAIAGLRSFAEIAHRMGDDSTRTGILKQLSLLEKGFNAAFIRDGRLRGTLEEGIKNDIDGALLTVINLGIVTDPALTRSTIERMELLKVSSGGYRRVRGTYTDPSIYEYWYEQEEFLFVDFSLAEVLRRLGHNNRADAIISRIVDKAAVDHNIIPEMYVAVDCPLFHGSIGDPTGARPMVGYGAGAYVLDLLQRDEITSRNSKH